MHTSRNKYTVLFLDEKIIRYYHIVHAWLYACTQTNKNYKGNEKELERKPTGNLKLAVIFNENKQ